MGTHFLRDGGGLHLAGCQVWLPAWCPLDEGGQDLICVQSPGRGRTQTLGLNPVAL